LFHDGKYTPLYCTGPKRDHVVAFARENHSQVAIVAAPRLSYTLAGGSLLPPLGEIWSTTELPVPSRTSEFLDNVFTGEKIKVTPGRTLLCRELFAHFPVALLISG
jgi:(1->4)-alpha-D-glucan 1-alpha-D-glucosylmutase